MLKKSKLTSVLCVIIVMLCFYITVKKENNTSSPIAHIFNTPESDICIDLSSINSKNAVLLDMENGNVIAEKKGNKRIYPASLTKIMTALVTLENCEGLDETMTVPYEIFDMLYSEDASMAGFLAGENVTVADLVYGMILPSGAECCMTAAYSISGSEENFVELMNKKAEELGMEDTHFTNTTGLHNKNHYTTVNDLAILTRYAMTNSFFKVVFTSQYHYIAPNEYHPDGFTFYSTLYEPLQSYEQITNGTILGGKTGYTDEAGLCLASCASIAGHEYLFITANADGDHYTEQLNITDAVNVYNQISPSVLNGS